MKRRIHQKTHSERDIAGGRRVELSFHLEKGLDVPATLLIPATEAPVPGALLIHGYSSHKEQMSDTVGRALLARGVASLSIDLPLHGTRRNSLQAQSMQNPLEVLRHWRLAVKESRLAVRYLRAHPRIDPERVAVAGYSLGSFLATLVAADEPAVRAVVVAAGGDLPRDTPFGSLARAVADPLRAVRQLRGRPLLVVHGRGDRTVRPEQAQRLFDAASEPKEIRWWDGGHHLPAAAIDEAAQWLADRLR